VTTETALTTVPHWLFPFLKTTVPLETLVAVGPSKVVKTVGYTLTAMWTTVVGYVTYVFVSKKNDET
jgi:hypothetical protein